MASVPFDDRDGEIWLDGQFVPWRDAKVHVLTHAIHYGGAVFEGQRAYEGHIFKLEEHTERLFRSAEILELAVPFSQSDVNEACKESLRRSGLTNAYQRPFIWRGSDTMGLAAPNAEIHVAVATWAWPAYFDYETRMKGLRLAIANWRRPAPDCAPVHAKASGLYQICTLAKNQATRDGFDDALMFDYRGLVAEATGANIFFYDGARLVTPMPDCFLNGITRQTVIEIAEAQGLEVETRHIKPEEMASFKEAFLTGTAAEVSPVRSIGDYSFEVGEVTQGMVRGYDALVRKAPVSV